jgi:DNA-binding NarL/FixJ family response regulator
MGDTMGTEGWTAYNSRMLRRLKAAGPKRRVFLADDHPIVREGLSHLINYQVDLEVCGQARTMAAAWAGIRGSKPDLVIVDISLVGGNGLDLAKQIVANLSVTRVLVLSVHHESVFAERAWRAGARGYVNKQSPASEILGAIRRVLRGELYFSDGFRKKLIRS